MTTVEPAPPVDTVITQRARLHTLMQRRRRLWRRILVLAIVTGVMVLVATLNRDTQYLREERKRGQMVADELQKEFEVRREFPLMFPSGKDPREDPWRREIEELDRKIERLDQEGPRGPEAIAELKRKRDELAREIEPLDKRRKEFEQQRKRHYFNMFYVSQQNPQGEVGVCCLEKPVRFYLRAEGRVVILFDGEHFSARWMPESEFRTQAEQLGFGNLLRK
jgi:hypothetical protein